jgi:hypothetical protein
LASIRDIGRRGLDADWPLLAAHRGESETGSAGSDQSDHQCLEGKPRQGSGKLATLKIAGKNLPSLGYTETIARADWGSPSNRPSEPNLLSSRLVWLKSDLVIHSVAESLLTSQVTLRSLYRYVSKKKLNLLQFAAGLVAESGTCSPQVMRCQRRKLARCCFVFDNSPNHFRAEAVSPDSTGLVDRT